ncbi:MAG TPA: GntR family transcriptional regulator [Candidatus Limnocylindrales bacterium]
MHVTIQALVIAALRKGILDGILMPGTRLRQEELALVFNTSRIPIREALRLLEHEGLLESEPNRGFSVKPIGADEIDEIYDLRIVLESHALQLAVPLLTDADLVALTELFEAMETVENREERRSKREEFYFRLYSVPARPRLLGLIVTMRRELARSLRWYAVPASEAHHRAFFEAVMQGDVHTAEKLLTTHYRKVASLLRRFIREAELRQRNDASEPPAARIAAGLPAGNRIAHQRRRRRPVARASEN